MAWWYRIWFSDALFGGLRGKEGFKLVNFCRNMSFGSLSTFLDSGTSHQICNLPIDYKTETDYECIF